jgi:signal transduction histidine kinase
MEMVGGGAAQIALPTVTRRRRWLAACAVVLVVLLLGTMPQLFYERPGAIPRLVYFVLEAPVVIVALSLHYERASSRDVDTTRALCGSLALSAVLCVLCTLVFFFLVRTFGIQLDEQGHQLTLPAILAFGTLTGVLQCGVWALGFVYPFAAADARLRTFEARTHKLEAEKLRLEADKLKLVAEKLKLEAERLRGAAELATLRCQLEPHFLLNTLNAVAGLVTRKPQEARRLLGCLGDLLRDSLRDAAEMQTLGDEMTWLHRYAEILESRHAGALRFRWEIDDDARAIMVPRLLLQPLVENAVNHGALQRCGGGEVLVRISVERTSVVLEHVVCTVSDNGPGLPDGEPRSGAFGIRSVRRRLELEYDGASLRLESTGEGTRAVVRLPRAHVPVAVAS